MFIVRNAFVLNEKKNTFSKLDNLQMYRTTMRAQQLHETEKNTHSQLDTKARMHVPLILVAFNVSHAE